MTCLFVHTLLCVVGNTYSQFCCGSKDHLYSTVRLQNAPPSMFPTPSSAPAPPWERSVWTRQNAFQRVACSDAPESVAARWTRPNASRRVQNAGTRRAGKRAGTHRSVLDAPHAEKKRQLEGKWGGSRKTGVFKVKWSELNLKTLPSLGLVTPGEPVGRSDL